MRTKFSIITPVYNGEQYIRKCIESIANSQYDLKNVEHIVVDDGSTDNTKQICEQLSKKYSHLKFYSKKNGNWGSVINFVKNNKLVHGDYVMICDSDDKLSPKAFSKVNRKIQQTNFKSDIYAGSFYLWNGKRKRIKINSYYFLFKKQLYKKTLMHYFSPLLLPFSTFFTKELFYQNADLKEKVSYQDNVLYASIYSRAKTIRILKTPFVYYWHNRDGNTMENIGKEHGIKNQMINYQYFSENNLIEPFFYSIIGLPKVRKYLIKNKIQYHFIKKRPDVSGFPWFAKPILLILFSIKVKRIIK